MSKVADLAKKQAQRFTTAELGLFVNPNHKQPCHTYSARLSGREHKSAAVTFQINERSGICEAKTRRPIPGDYELILTVAAGTNSREIPLSVRVTAQSQEIELRLLSGFFGEYWESRIWPDSSSRKWWQAAVSWLPGLEIEPDSVAQSIQRRPLFAQLRTQCTDNPNMENLAGMMALMAVHSVQKYAPTDMAALTNCSLSLDLPNAARDFLNHWHSLVGNTEQVVEAKLKLAMLQYRIGKYGNIVDELDTVEFKGAQQARARHVKAMALMALGQMTEAVSVLKEGDHLTTQADIEALEAAGRPDMFMRYNLAIAWLASGHKDEALVALDSLGRRPSNSRVSSALIDRSNLLLGWHFINQGAGASAAPVFKRISLDGPFSREAILGLGWAYIVAPGQPLKRVAQPLPEYKRQRPPPAFLRAEYQAGRISCDEYRQALDDSAVCLREQHFRQADRLKDKPDTDKAIRAWSHLLKLDLPDVTSIEGFLALADALAAQGSSEWANHLFNKAVFATEAQLHALDNWWASVDTPEDLTKSVPPMSVQMWLHGAEPHLLMDLLTQLLQPNTLGTSKRDHALALRNDVWQAIHLLLENHVTTLREQYQTWLVDARFKYARHLERGQ